MIKVQIQMFFLTMCLEVSKQSVLPSGVTVSCLRGALQTSEQSDSSTDGSHGNSDSCADEDQQVGHTSHHQQVETVSSLPHSGEHQHTFRCQMDKLLIFKIILFFLTEETHFPEQPKVTFSP